MRRMRTDPWRGVALGWLVFMFWPLFLGLPFYLLYQAFAGVRIHDEVIVGAILCVAAFWPLYRIFRALAGWMMGREAPLPYACPLCGADIHLTPHRCPSCGARLMWGELPDERPRLHHLSHSPTSGSPIIFSTMAGGM